MATQRTDGHQPSAFDPSRYQYLECLDTQPVRPWTPHEVAVYFWGRSAEAQAAKLAELNAEVAAANQHRLDIAARIRGDHPSISQCSVCGARYRYAVVWTHTPDGTLITTGEECAASIDATAASQVGERVGVLRDAAQRLREREQAFERRAAWLAADPRNDEAADYITSPRTERDGFLDSLADQWMRKGELSPRQVDAALASRDRMAKRAAEAIGRAFAQMHEPHLNEWVGNEGDRLTFCATVLFTRALDSDYGIKVLVGMRDAQGHALRTFATGHFADDAHKGDTLHIIGTVKRHEEYKGERQTILTRVAVAPAPQPTLAMAGVA
jgi:hypothetical protein